MEGTIEEKYSIQCDKKNNMHVKEKNITNGYESTQLKMTEKKEQQMDGKTTHHKMR